MEWVLTTFPKEGKYILTTFLEKNESVYIKTHLLWCLMGFPGGSNGKKSAYNLGDLGSIPGLGRSPEEGKAYLLQYSALENSMDCRVRQRVGHD